MSSVGNIDISSNPDFNRWLNENYSVEIEEYTYPSDEVLYQMSYSDYVDAWGRFKTDPKIRLSRIEDGFPTPIAYYFYQVQHSAENPHHRLDLLKSCWESIAFFLFGLVVGEARHRKLDLKSLGIRWKTYWSDRIHDKLTITENILDYADKSGIQFGCSSIVDVPTLAQIRKLNQERNGFAHSAAKNKAQQMALYDALYPQLELVLRQLIKLEDVLVFRYHDAQTPLYPRCEILRNHSLECRKEIVSLKKDSYIEVLDHFDANSIFAKVDDSVFCLSPFIHFFQETHESHPAICFYKQTKGGKYHFEIVGKSQNREFEKTVFSNMVNQLAGLIQ
ncbi:MAG: hypothetical protein H8E28_14910 [Anaerolineae bacterium]|nr:hypothetical protein [Anaerolineae bacterium]